MTKKRHMIHIDPPADAVAAPIQNFPAGKVMDPRALRSPMAIALSETLTSTGERQEIEAQIRADNDDQAHEYFWQKRLGMVVELVPLDRIRMQTLVRDRKNCADPELAELRASARELRLSSPIRLEVRQDGRCERCRPAVHCGRGGRGQG